MADFDLRTSNLNLLPALEALLSEASVSGAARRMGVSQSAMSHSLARLRELFDDPLLVPSGRQLARTPRADLLAASLPDALERLRHALHAPRPFEPTESTRSFTIATLDYFELTSLPSVYRALSEEAPGVALHVERIAGDTISRLAAGDIDLLFTGGAARIPQAGLRKQSLYRDPFAVIARKDHPSIGRRLSLARYAALDHVLVSVEGRGDGAVDRALRERGLRRRVALRVPHFFAAPLAVMDSDLICTVAESVAWRARRLFDLRLLEPPIELPSVPIAAYWSRRVDADPGHRWFRDLLVSGRALSPRIRRLMKKPR